MRGIFFFCRWQENLLEKIEVTDQFSVEDFLDFTNPCNKRLIGFSIGLSLQRHAIYNTVFHQNVVFILNCSMVTVLVTFVVAAVVVI